MPSDNEMHPFVSIIIPNWNGARWLPQCLDSLLAQSYPSDRYEVIVVDNGSTDESRSLLTERYPQVRVEALPRNLGFAPACNLGMRRAKGDILVLFNNDACAASGWLEALVRGLCEHPEAGSAAAKVLLMDRPDTFNAAGDFYGVDGVPGNRGVWEQDRGQYDTPAWVFAPMAAAAAYRRTMLDQIGMLDEDFGSYCEDVDLGWRAQLAGYKCIYVPDAVVHHQLSATGGGPIASYFCGRNFIYLIVKDVPTPLLKKYWPRMLRAQIRYMLESLRHFREPAARARLRGQFASLLHLPMLLRKRRQIQSHRRAGLKSLDALLQRKS